jgi:hypothetical protein
LYLSLARARGGHSRNSQLRNAIFSVREVVASSRERPAPQYLARSKTGATWRRQVFRGVERAPKERSTRGDFFPGVDRGRDRLCEHFPRRSVMRVMRAACPRAREGRTQGLETSGGRPRAAPLCLLGVRASCCGQSPTGVTPDTSTPRGWQVRSYGALLQQYSCDFTDFHGDGLFRGGQFHHDDHSFLRLEDREPLTQTQRLLLASILPGTETGVSYCTLCAGPRSLARGRDTQALGIGTGPSPGVRMFLLPHGQSNAQ